MSILSRIFGGKKGSSQVKGLKRLTNRGLKLEALEERQLLSVSTISPTGFSLVKDTDNNESHTTELKDTATLNFENTAETGNIVFGIVTAATDNQFVTSKIEVRNAAGDVVSQLSSEYANRKGIVLVSLGKGEYTIEVTSAANKYGDFECEVYLPGDLNGDGKVVDSEVKEAVGAWYYVHRGDPSVSTFEHYDLYYKAAGHDEAWYAANYMKFDYNRDGYISDIDTVDIAANNRDRTNPLSASLQTLVSLNADQTGPVVEDPVSEPGGPVYEESTDPTFDYDIYADADKPASLTFADDSNIVSYQIGDNEHVLETPAQSVKINLNEDTLPEIDEDGSYHLTIVVTDEYGNETERNIRYFYTEEAPAKPTITATTVTGTEKYDADNVFYEVNLANINGFITGVDSKYLVFKEVSGTLSEVTGQYKVLYSITKAGLLTVSYEVAEGATAGQPYEWLSTLSSADAEKNLKQWGIVVTATHKQYEKSEESEWSKGTLTVKLTPANDAPVANSDTGAATQGALATIDVLANDTDVDAWDKLSVVNVSGTEEMDRGTLGEGDYEGAYNGMTYVNIKVTTTEGDKIIRVILNTNAAYDTDKSYSDDGTAKTGSQNRNCKLVVDLLGNFDFLRVGATLGFTFNYTMKDAASTETKSAAVSVTVTGTNDQPVVSDYTATSADENTAVTALPDVDDVDTYARNDVHTYAIDATQDPVWRYYQGGTLVTEGDAYNKIKAKLEDLGPFDYISVVDQTTDTSKTNMIQFNPNNAAGTSDFAFLGVGESLEIDYGYYATDDSGSDNKTSATETITFAVTGVNNTPTPADVTITEGTINTTAATITIADVTPDSGGIDPDVNDAHTFSQVVSYNANGEKEYLDLTTTAQNLYTMVGTTRTYIGKISVNATGTEVTFSAAYPTETTIDATYLKYSFNTADTATFNLTFVIKDDSGADNATAECNVGVKMAGIYDKPEIVAGQNITIPVLADSLKANDTVKYHVDNGLTAASWSISTTFDYTTSATKSGTLNTADYFTFADGQLSFTSETTRSAFIAAVGIDTDNPSSVLTFEEVTVTDSAATPGTSDPVVVNYTAQRKAAPVVTVESSSSGINVWENGSDGTHDPGTAVLTAASTALKSMYTVSFAADEPTDPTDPNYREGTKYWYDFADIALDRATSTIDYTSGSVKLNDTALTDVLSAAQTTRLNAFATNNSGAYFGITAIDSTTGAAPTADSLIANITWTLTVKMYDGTDTSSNKIFDFLSSGDTATLNFTLNVKDTKYGSSTPVTLTVVVKGQNDAPTIVATDPTTTKVFDVNDTAETAASYTIWNGKNTTGNLIEDPDWRDTVTYKTLAFAGGVYGHENEGKTALEETAKTAAELQTLLGMSNDDFIALLGASVSTGSSSFTYAGNTDLQALKLTAITSESLKQGEYVILNYTFFANDNNNADSSAQKTVSIKVTGTNQNPTDIDNVNGAVDLQTTTTETTEVSLDTARDVDMGNTLTAEYDFNATTGGLLIRVGGVDKTGIYKDGFTGAVSRTGNTLSLDNAALVTAFESLQQGTVATVTFSYAVHDEHDAYCVDADGNTLYKTVTITITGRNEAPTASDITGLAVTQNSSTGVVIDWSTNSSDPDTVLANDKRTLASINGETITATADSPQIISITDNDDNDFGYIKVTVDAEGVQTATYYANGSDYLKWHLNATGDHKSVAIDITYIVKDEHNAISNSATAGLTVNGVFDPIEMTTSAQKATTTAKEDVGDTGWVTFGTLNYQKDIDETYVFGNGASGANPVSVVADDGVTVAIATSDIKFVTNADGKTVTVKITKTALTAIEAELADGASFGYTVTFGYNNSVADRDTVTDKTFALTVSKKSAITGLDFGKDIPETSTTATTQKLNDLPLQDPDNTGNTVTVTDCSTTVTLGAITFTDGTNTVAWTFPTADEQALLDCVVISNAGTTAVPDWQITFNPSSSLYSFLPVGYTMSVKFNYTVTQYKSADETYDVASAGVFTLTVTGVNTAPTAENATYATKIDGTVGTATNIPLTALYGSSSSLKMMYDVDGNPSTTVTERITDLKEHTFQIENSAGNWVELSTTTAVTITSNDYGAVTAQLVNTGTTETPEWNLQINVGSYYKYTSGDTTLPIVFRAVDKQDATSGEATLTLTVNGKYVAPSIKKAMDDKEGNIAGYESSNGKLTYDMSEYFNYAEGVLDKSNFSLAGFEANDYIEGYEFVDDGDGTVSLVFQFKAQTDYNAMTLRSGTADSTLCAPAGTLWDFAAMEGLTVTVSDGVNTPVTSGEFAISCAQDNVTQLYLVATNDVPFTTNKYDVNVAKLPGTQTSYSTVKTNHTDNTDSRLTAQDTVYSSVTDINDSTKTHSGFYLELWLTDNEMKYFNTTVTGIQGFGALISWTDTASAVTGISITDDPCTDADFGGSSVGWGNTISGDGQNLYTDVYKTVDGVQVKQNMAYITIAWSANVQTLYAPVDKANAAGTYDYGTTRYGSDGTTSLLVCRLWVSTSSTDILLSDLKFTLTVPTTDYVWKDTSGVYHTLTAGYNYKRTYNNNYRTDTEKYAINTISTNESQVSSAYATYTKSAVSGTTVVETEVGGGVYVRTVTEKTDATVVNTLGINADYINEWQTNYAELWVKGLGNDTITSATVTLTYNPKLFTPAEVEFDGLFDGKYEIDYEAGTITIDATATDGMYSTDRYIMIGRVTFSALAQTYTDGDGVVRTAQAEGIKWSEGLAPHMLGITLGDSYVNTASKQRIDSYLGLGSSTEVWAVPYDTDDDGNITYLDYGHFINGYNNAFGSECYATMFDFDQDGQITYLDYGYLISYYNQNKAWVANGGQLQVPSAFLRRYVGTTLEAGGDAAQVGYVLDAANNAWKEALGLETTTDVQIVVTNLGDTQLANTVTVYDGNGELASAIIYVDDDAMGATWYAQVEEGATGSSKYDLYTVLLHELGHVYGFDDHSDVEADVLNAELDPGVRKSITVNDAYLVASAYASINADYVVPQSILDAWNAQNVVLAAAVAESETVEPTIVCAMADTVDTKSDENEIPLLDDENTDRIDRDTLGKLNSLGLNVPGFQIVPNRDELVAGALDSMIADDEEEDDRDTIDQLNDGEDDSDFNQVLDVVLAEYDI